jgi:hypothetical protein
VSTSANQGKGISNLIATAIQAAGKN